MLLKEKHDLRREDRDVLLVAYRARDRKLDRWVPSEEPCIAATFVEQKLELHPIGGRRVVFMDWQMEHRGRVDRLSQSSSAQPPANAHVPLKGCRMSTIVVTCWEAEA